MKFQQKPSILASAILIGFSSYAAAANTSPSSPQHIEFGAAHIATASKQAPMPRTPQALPPSLEQIKFQLPESKKPRTDLLPSTSKANKLQASSTLASNPDCEDMNKLASYSGAALAEYIVNLPSYECHYGLFSLNSTDGAKVFSANNFAAVTSRFITEAAAYNASNMKLVNLLIYLRAGYYLAGNNVIAQPATNLMTSMRPAIGALIDGNSLYQANTLGPSTAGETFTFITNMHDEGYYLPRMKNVIQRFTNSSSNPNAASALTSRSGGGAMTGALTVIYFSHYRGTVDSALQNDASYPKNFV